MPAATAEQIRLSWLALSLLGAPALSGCHANGDHWDGAVSDAMVVTPIGAPCQASQDCLEGRSPVCWIATLGNQSGALAFPGGYCSSSCQTDRDCGVTGTCQEFTELGGKFCLAACSDSAGCRAETYACLLVGGCYPSSLFNCDPTVGDGTCTLGSGQAGGCRRFAYGTGMTGQCAPSCRAGVGTCPAVSAEPQQCVVEDFGHLVDGTTTNDKFKGPLCLATVGNPGPEIDGAFCSYPNAAGGVSFVANACVDGDQCYLRGNAAPGHGYDPAGDNRCHRLCSNAAGGPVCASPQTCHDIWGLLGTRSSVGLCL